jgi:uncharacterized integral membrane protein
MNAKVILLIVILSLFLILTLQNADVAVFNVFFWQIEMSRIVFMYLAGLFGFLLGFILAKMSKKTVHHAPEPPEPHKERSTSGEV